MDCVYPTAAVGIRAGLIDMRRGKIRAALVKGYTFRPHHRHVSDVVKSGGQILVESEPLDTSRLGQEGGDAMGAAFPGTDSTEGACVVVFQSARSKSAADLPRTAQRLITWADQFAPVQVGG